MGMGGNLLGQLAGLFAFGGGTAVGLSLGSSSVKLVELKKSGKHWKLIHFGLAQLPEDAIVNREIINPVAVVDAVKGLVAQIKPKNKSVCSSLSGTSMIIKNFKVELPNLKEVQDQVFWEAEQYLPFDVNEVVMDYQLLKQSKKEKTAEVLLVAVKETVLDSYMKVITDSGLKPGIIDVDFFALQNTFETNYPNSGSEAVALVDIGAVSTKISVIYDGVPVFTKDSVLGGRTLTAEIQKSLNLSFTDAETLKVGGQGDQLPQEVSELMEMMSDNFAGEVKRALDYYSASSSGAPVSYVLLAGGSAKIPDLSRVVEEKTGLPTQVMNPFNSIVYDPNVFTQDYVAAIAPIAAVPIGLALRAGAKS